MKSEDARNALLFSTPFTSLISEAWWGMRKKAIFLFLYKFQNYLNFS